MQKEPQPEHFLESDVAEPSCREPSPESDVAETSFQMGGGKGLHFFLLYFGVFKQVSSPEREYVECVVGKCLKAEEGLDHSSGLGWLPVPLIRTQSALAIPLPE